MERSIRLREVDSIETVADGYRVEHEPLSDGDE